MTQYNCRFQIYRRTGLFARKNCEGCSPDPVNNPKCPDYSPVALKDFEKVEGRTFKSITKIDSRLAWKVDNQLKKLEKIIK
jgi:hypothetical protein